MSELPFGVIGSATPGHYGAAARELMLAEVTITSAWQVNGDLSRAAFVQRVRQALEVDLPFAPNTMVRSDVFTAYWLGPDSWLLVGGRPTSLVQYIEKRDALNEVGGALFDVSASRVAYRVRGARTPDLLSAGCPLDFSLESFPMGTCRRSVFARVGALFDRRTGAPDFTLFVARSFADDVWHALCLLASAYGYDVQPVEHLS